MPVTCSHVNKCKSTTCKHREPHEFREVRDHCKETVCGYAMHKVKCIEVTGDWDT